LSCDSMSSIMSRDIYALARAVAHLLLVRFSCAH
jgi:hypothetical protein